MSLLLDIILSFLVGFVLFVCLCYSLMFLACFCLDCFLRSIHMYPDRHPQCQRATRSSAAAAAAAEATVAAAATATAATSAAAAAAALGTTATGYECDVAEDATSSSETPSA